MPLIGSHATVTGGVAAGGLSYAAEVGAEVFRGLLAALPDVPFVVETPGGKAGHARDIATLKELRSR